jgi:large subunit ribosomal protein L35
MPKMKTRRSAKKRFKRTGTGKIMRRKAFLGHLMETKSGTRKRRLKRAVVVDGVDKRRVRDMLGE